MVAHALNEDVTVSMARVSDKPMSFTSLNGNLNVTLPASIKASVRLEAGNGEIYSDFDVDMRCSRSRSGKAASAAAVANTCSRSTQAVVGRINGGGPELTFKTFNGDIRIRKGA